MAAAPRKSAAPPPKKRKVRNETPPLSECPSKSKKKSPLFDKPQNYYAPSAVSAMTKEELMEWRKEQRRKRNRESAAASRNKQRAQIEELEGEVNQWKKACRDMEARMHCLERHIMVLTKLNGCGRRVAGEPSHSPPQVVSLPPSPSISPLTVVSQSASPSGSPPSSPPPSLVVPSTVTSFAPPMHDLSSRCAAHLFPPLLSDPRDLPLGVKLEAAAAAVSDEESRKHLTLIPRHAVKITGATSNSSLDTQQRQQLPTIPVLNSLVKIQETEEVCSIVSSGTSGEKSSEVACLSEAADKEKEKEGKFSCGGSTALDLSDDDEDFLDLLVDTFEGEFDPNLLL